MPWLLVELQVSVALHLAVSHKYYDIVQELVSGCIAMLIRNVLRCSTLM
jgi:hypothetical protein